MDTFAHSGTFRAWAVLSIQSMSGQFRFGYFTDHYEETLAFYREGLELPVLESWDRNPDDRGTLFAAASGMIEVLFRPRGESSHLWDARPAQGAFMVIEVEQVDALFQKAVEKRLPIQQALTDQEWGHRSFCVREPNGLTLYLFQPLPGASTYRAGAFARSRRGSVGAAMGDVLKHPAFLLIVGAVLSGLLVPWLTQRWQDHQKELELKTQLATEITETVTVFATALQFAEVGAPSQTAADFDAAYRDWLTRSAVITSKLQVYFPDTRLPDEWGRYARFVSDFYEATGSDVGKAARLRRLLDVAGGSRTLPAYEQEYLSRLPSFGVSEAQIDWATLKAHALSWKDSINQEMLKARSILTSRRLAL